MSTSSFLQPGVDFWVTIREKNCIGMASTLTDSYALKKFGNVRKQF